MLQSAAIVFLITISGILCATLHLPQAEDSNDTEPYITEYSCANCTAVRLRHKSWNGTVIKITDLSCDVNNPYCDFQSGTCHKTTNNDTCSPVDPDFLCTNDGFFPHPANCHNYYSCIKGKAYLRNCGYDYYNVKSETCQSSYTCYYINCVGKSGIKIPHGGDPAYYGYCVNGTVFRVDKCPGKFQLDSTLQMCIPACDEEGHQGDPFDCTRYYKCYYGSSTTTMTLTHEQCPEDELYDALNLHCAPKQIGLTCESGRTYFGEDKFV